MTVPQCSKLFECSDEGGVMAPDSTEGGMEKTFLVLGMPWEIGSSLFLSTADEGEGGFRYFLPIFVPRRMALGQRFIGNNAMASYLCQQGLEASGCGDRPFTAPMAFPLPVLLSRLYLQSSRPVRTAHHTYCVLPCPVVLAMLFCSPLFLEYSTTRTKHAHSQNSALQ